MYCKITYCITDNKVALLLVSLVHADFVLHMWQIFLLQKILWLFLPDTIVLSVLIAVVVGVSQVGTSGLTARTIVPPTAPDCQVSHGPSVWQTPHSASPLTPMSP